jgi:hypothetical protein
MAGAGELCQAQREALQRLAGVRVRFGGKPIPSRDELYDGHRG